MMNKGVGHRYLKGIKNVYNITSYVPQVSKNALGKEIPTEHDVTQGKPSSANIFSFYISDMHQEVDQLNSDDYMDPFNLLQLADDTTILAESILSSKRKANQIEKYSNKKRLKINITKTKYLNMSNNENASRETVVVSEELSIEAVKDNEGYNWLGFWLSHTNIIPNLIKFNLKKKLYNTAKFYEWVQMNEDTPFQIKVNVLYSCLFSSLLYSSEAWGDVSNIENQILEIERKAIKSIIGVKAGTSDNIIYTEINRPDIVSTIKDRQYNFINKIVNIRSEEAIVKGIYDLYKGFHYQHEGTGMLHYYESLLPNNRKRNMEDKVNAITNSNATMCKRYVDLIGIPDKKLFLYTALVNDNDRRRISRWRLSSHNLFVETGRYKRPKVPKHQRICMICHVMEDEVHALYRCKAHDFIRYGYNDLLLKYDAISTLLNPQSLDDIRLTANYLREIEENMKKLKMIQ